MTLARAITVFGQALPDDFDRVLAENGWAKAADVIPEEHRPNIGFAFVVPVPSGGEGAPLTAIGFQGPPEVGAACRKIGLAAGARVAWSDAFDTDMPIPPRALAADEKRIRKARKRLAAIEKQRR